MAAVTMPVGFAFERIRRDRDAVARSGVFDAEWYRFNQHRAEWYGSKWHGPGWYSAIGRKLDRYWSLGTAPFERRIDQALHYICRGAHLDPSPFFDATWYLEQNPDAGGRHTAPLLHYLRVGAREGADPHPDFSGAAYFRRYLDARASGMTALEHYVSIGASEGRDARPGMRRPAKPLDDARLVCVFSHFDRNGRILRHVQLYLRELRRCGFEVHLVSTSPRLDAEDRRKVEAIGVRVYCRENTGLDFGSWQWAFRHSISLETVDWLLLANDSVFGPMFDLKSMVEEQTAAEPDFWGITDSNEIAWHLQSYFLCLRGDVVRSQAFRQVFSLDFASRTKERIIRDGEVGLSQALRRAGFRGKAICRVERLQPKIGRRNPTYFGWDLLIARFRCPFIKRALLNSILRDDGRIEEPNWIDFLERYTGCEASLILEALDGAGKSG